MYKVKVFPQAITEKIQITQQFVEAAVRTLILWHSQVRLKFLKKNTHYMLCMLCLILKLGNEKQEWSELTQCLNFLFANIEYFHRSVDVSDCYG